MLELAKSWLPELSARVPAPALVKVTLAPLPLITPRFGVTVVPLLMPTCVAPGVMVVPVNVIVGAPLRVSMPLFSVNAPKLAEASDTAFSSEL